MTDAVVSAILAYGAPGLIIAVLMFVVRWQNQRITDIQEERISELKESARREAATAAALDVANKNTALVLAELETRRRLEMSIGILRASPAP